MDQNSFNRTRWTVWIALAILGAGLLSYAVRKHGAINRPKSSAIAVNPVENKKSPPPAAIFTDYSPPTTNALGPALNINPNTVLASVNGHALIAQEVLPPGYSNQPVSFEACKYFVQRAIDRELILQTAKAQGVSLNDSQQQQMLDFETTREQHGPDLVRSLNDSAAEIVFEMRDAEAFMLQTSLLQRAGASPNVTSQQVLNYYQQHASEFGELPADGFARQEAWDKIDFYIRETLASKVRSDFQTKLTDYMNGLKTGANIQFTSLAALAGPS
ncbi:MAG TPA: hypothetical protein VHC44_09005 [Verrucomicrobiae bacterium]|nr:hypothetical protein [Verrucomicrobiae bacterium]